MEKKKMFIYGGIALAVISAIAGIYFFVSKKKEETPPPPPADDTLDKTQTQVKTVVVVPTFPLQKGGKGNEVKQLQKWLNTNILMKIKKDAYAGKTVIAQKTIIADGNFGSGTETALKYVTGRGVMEKSDYDNMKIANA